MKQKKGLGKTKKYNLVKTILGAVIILCAIKLRIGGDPEDFTLKKSLMKRNEKGSSILVVLLRKTKAHPFINLTS